MTKSYLLRKLQKFSSLFRTTQTSGDKSTASSPKTSARQSPPSSAMATPKRSAATTSADNMSQCTTCGRNFNSDRLAKHQEICEKAAAKKRKVFDATSHRIKVGVGLVIVLEKWEPIFAPYVKPTAKYLFILSPKKELDCMLLL